MTSREFRDRLTRRLHAAPAPIPTPPQIEQLEAYFRLLVQWNARINLTALPLERPTDDSLDRLFAEPLAAARYFPGDAVSWVDLGTGGGSPAIPLKVVLPSNRLLMVESKVRKTAFLREVIRGLQLVEASVANERFEAVAESRPESTHVLTVRAVRPDSPMFDVAARLLISGGRLLLFQTDRKAKQTRQLHHLETVQLLDAKPSHLAVYCRPFHVEQRR